MQPPLPENIGDGDLRPYAPLFLQQTYAMVDDPSNDNIVCWSGPDSFLIRDQNLLASDVLPRYFKHNNFSRYITLYNTLGDSTDSYSFVRQLNGYGFRKVSPDQWNFHHEKFCRNQPHLLREMTRRKTGKQAAVAAAATTSPVAQPPTPGPVGTVAETSELEALRMANHNLLQQLQVMKQVMLFSVYFRCLCSVATGRATSPW